MLNFAFLTPKRHFLIRKDIFWCISWNFLTSGVGCTLVQEPQKGEKMPSRLYMLGICRQVTPYANVMKFGTVGLLGYVIALTAVGPHRLTGFGVSRHQSWVPSIDKAHRAYYTAVPATAGTHDGWPSRLEPATEQTKLVILNWWTNWYRLQSRLCSA